MKKLILLVIVFVAPFTWGQFLVSNQSTVQSLDANLTEWAFPNNLRPYVFLPTPDGSLYTGSPRDALTVMQGEFGILSANDSRFSVLSSTGAAPCVMVILRPSDNLALGHSHFDAITSTAESISAMLAGIRLHSNAPVEAVLAGQYSEAGLMSRIVSDLRSHGITNIKFYRSSAIAIDKSGKIFFNGVYSDNLIPLQTRRDALSLEIKSYGDNIGINIEKAQQKINCDYECIMSQLRRPLRPLYISERP